MIDIGQLMKGIDKLEEAEAALNQAHEFFREDELLYNAALALSADVTLFINLMCLIGVELKPSDTIREGLKRNE